jgi:hypothetical protein
MRNKAPRIPSTITRTPTTGRIARTARVCSALRPAMSGVVRGMARPIITSTPPTMSARMSRVMVAS